MNRAPSQRFHPLQLDAHPSYYQDAYYNPHPHNYHPYNK